MSDTIATPLIDDNIDCDIRALTNMVPSTCLEPQDVFLIGDPGARLLWLRSLVAGIVYGMASELTPAAVVNNIIPALRSEDRYYKRFSTPMFFVSSALPDPAFKRVVYLQTKDDNRHFDAWKSNPFQAEMLIVKFDDLQENTIEQLHRICEFTGQQRAAELLERVAANVKLEKASMQ